jgi:4'-phosphopantetheinyl transferase
MLRLILSRYCRTPARQLIFDQTPHGKPLLINAPELQFNLSHSGDMALLAVGCDYPLGVDLEFFAARPYEGIGSHMFSVAENQALKAAPAGLRALAFFHMWAQKEALIKACGLGLSYPTQQFDVPALPSTNQPVFDSLHEKTWQMISFQPQVSCCAALCYNSAITEIRYRSIPAEDTGE